MTESQGSQTVFVGSGWTLIKLERSPFYYVVAHEKGKRRLYKSTDTAHIGEAKKKAAELYRAYLLEAKREKVNQARLNSPKVLEDAWAKYITLERAKISTDDLDEATLKRKINAWERMEYFWGGKRLDELTQSNFILFAAEHEAKYPNCSLQSEFKYLRALANFLHNSGFIAKKPILKLGKEKAKSRTERRKFLDAELKRLIAKADEVGSVRQRALIYLGVYCGFRLSEVGKLKTKNVIEKSGTIFLKLEDTKTDKNRTVQIPAICLSVIKEALASAGSNYVFENARDKAKRVRNNTLDNDWRKIFQSAKVEGVFHELRHTAISHAVQKFELAKVSLYFGVSIQTLMKVYVHLDEHEIGVVSGAINL